MPSKNQVEELDKNKTNMVGQMATKRHRRFKTIVSKIKELNTLLEQTLEKANNKKLEKINKEATLKKTDAAHHLR